MAVVARATGRGSHGVGETVNRYLITGEEQRPSIGLDSNWRPIEAPLTYSVEVVAPTAEDAWFMHSRRCENEFTRQETWIGNRPYQSKIVQRRRPTAIECIGPVVVASVTVP